MPAPEAPVTGSYYGGNVFAAESVNHFAVNSRRKDCNHSVLFRRGKGGRTEVQYG